MEWDGRAKVLMCHYNTCRHVIRMGDQEGIPNREKISIAIREEYQAIHHRAPDDSVFAF